MMPTTQRPPTQLQTVPLQFCNFFNDFSCCTPQVDEEMLQNFILMYSLPPHVFWRRSHMQPLARLAGCAAR